ncbi:DUF1120 domain-containing protein [Pseudomonas sp. NPDC087612]|uniref:DUF1120 domain-containing protein n=1 Tax=unclassified Pseudomonas TaxID=196821 RepID=UPI0005EBA116|nr:DUF1120 domain-containing protein [Pseudomonas sp. 2(2015)]KJK15631.1 hypothetical protein UB48_19705 [Pseudomonas sp. 2(2015)]
MKKSVLSLAALMSLATANAMASTAELTVTGTITPTACTPTLGNGGVVDYGNIALSNLEEGPTEYKLPAKTLSLSIDCDGPTTFALAANDNRRDATDPRNYRFGLGMHEGESFGSYMMSWEFENTLIDGEQGYNFYSDDGGHSWSGLGDDRGSLADTGKTPGFRAGIAKSIQLRPDPARNVSLLMDLRGYIKKSLTVTGTIPIDGSSTIEVFYL